MTRSCGKSFLFIENIPNAPVMMASVLAALRSRFASSVSLRERTCICGLAMPPVGTNGCFCCCMADESLWSPLLLRGDDGVDAIWFCPAAGAGDNELVVVGAFGFSPFSVAADVCPSATGWLFLELHLLFSLVVSTWCDTVVIISLDDVGPCKHRQSIKYSYELNVHLHNTYNQW